MSCDYCKPGTEMPCLYCGGKVELISLSKKLEGMNSNQLMKRLEANTNERFAIIRKIQAVKK
jgi:hypothetical protein